jgi:hypothetical protein
VRYDLAIIAKRTPPALQAEVSRLQQDLRPYDEGENRGMQERNDFLLSQIITEGLSLAVRCFREARTQTDLRLYVQAPNGS